MKALRYCLLVLLMVIPLRAEELLTVDKAIRIGLENNFSIRSARNSSEIAGNNRTFGTAGFLPRLDLSGNYSLSKTSETSDLESFFGDNDAETIGASANLNWTLFDGMKMFSEKGRYNALAKAGEHQYRDVIETNVVSIARAFFKLVQEERLLEVARNSLEVSEDRLAREKVRRDLGGSSSTDFLNAQVAYNSDRSSFLSMELAVLVAREDLNVLLGREPDSPLEVDKDFDIAPLEMSQEDVLGAAFERNSAINAAYHSRKAADFEVRSARAPFLPTVGLSASYSYQDVTRTPEGSSIDYGTETRDARVGLQLSYNLFNGNQDRIRLQNARLEAINQELAYRDAANRLEQQVREAIETFDRQLELVSLEEQNVEAARQSLELQRARFDIGSASSIEFRDAQVSYIRAQTALITSRYTARIARLEIDRLIGNLDVD